MEMGRLKFLICECDREISIRALSRHLKSNRFLHSKTFIEKCISIIELAKKNRLAWKISEGVNATHNEYWCASVLMGESRLEDWTFDTPRACGQMSPISCKKISEERKGKNNPSVKDKPIYDISTLSHFAKQFYADNSDSPTKYRDLKKKMKEKFPFFGFSFIGLWEHKITSIRGHSRDNLILSILLDKKVDDIIEEKALDRGKLIQKGQAKSNKFQKMKTAGRKALRGFVTIPHCTLYNMILSVDENAKKEYQVDYGETWKSYDIYSPKLNMVMEMHGHIWHDPTKCKPNMLPLVNKNVKNDKIKEKLAESLGLRFTVFWDDQTDKWEKQIEELYGRKPKKYAEAHSEEIDRKERRRSI